LILKAPELTTNTIEGEKILKERKQNTNNKKRNCKLTSQPSGTLSFVGAYDIAMLQQLGRLEFAANTNKTTQPPSYQTTQPVA
jgi:PIN domain nuclease of toxin-antitoxin system